MVGRVKRKIRWLLWPAACLLAGAANAQALPSVFGVQLGAPVTLPECRRMEGMPLSSSGMPAYELEQPNICARQPYQLSTVPLRVVDVYFPQEAKPEISSVNMIVAYLAKDDDKVIGIEASTPGNAAAAYIIAQLTAKFGKPTQVIDDHQVVGNVSIATKHVIWKHPGFTVDYQSADPFGPRVGKLLVSTGDYDRLKKEGAATEAAKRTPL